MPHAENSRKYGELSSGTLLHGAAIVRPHTVTAHSRTQSDGESAERIKMQSFFDAYVDAALWSSIDDNDEPLDSNYAPSDIDRKSFEKMRADCNQFQTENAEYLTADNVNTRYGVDAQAGHDFWLTREHHGCGFWDGDWVEPAATKLTESAHRFGEVYLFVGDDGKIYQG